MSRWAGERLNKQFADLRAKNEAPVGNGRGLPWHRSGVGGGAVVPTGGMRLQTLRAVTAGWEAACKTSGPWWVDTLQSASRPHGKECSGPNVSTLRLWRLALG